MGEFTVRFRFDTTTGQKEIIVEYESEDDAMPVEHERRHREIVENLLGQGIIRPDESGNVKVERVKPGPTKAPPTPNEPGREPVKT
jgi:hypothetical protein